MKMCEPSKKICNLLFLKYLRQIWQHFLQIIAEDSANYLSKFLFNKKIVLQNLLLKGKKMWEVGNWRTGEADQVTLEINMKKYYDLKYGFLIILRYAGYLRWDPSSIEWIGNSSWQRVDAFAYSYI